MGSLERGAGPLVVGRAASVVTGLVLPVVLARQLDAPSYGTYKQIFLVANLVTYSLQLGLAQSLFYFVPRATSEDERRAFIGQTQVLLAIVALVAAVGVFIGI